MEKFRVDIVQDDSEFDSLADAWQQLAAHDDDAGLFNDWQWNRLWWKHYSHLGELYVLVVYRGRQVVGIGPFYRTTAKRFRCCTVDTLKFIGSGGDTNPDDLNVLTHASTRQDVLTIICDHLLGKEVPAHVFLTDMPVATPFYATLTAAMQAARGYSTKPLVKPRHGAILPADWRQYRQQISRNTHKQMKRRRNRFDKAGKGEFHVCTTAEDVERVGNALIKLHNARWRSKNEVGSFQSPEYIAFHRELMLSLLKSGQLQLMALKLNGDIIAVEYAFTCKGCMLFFQTGFDPHYESLSPGHLLITYAIKWAIESGVEEIDLLMGDYAYKSSYANQIKLTADVGYYRSGFFSLLARAKDIVIRRSV